MVNGQTALRKDLLQVAVGERVSQIPADAEEDDHIFEVSSAEQCWPFSGHDIPYQTRSSTFATEPAMTQSRNDSCEEEDPFLSQVLARVPPKIDFSDFDAPAKRKCRGWNGGFSGSG